MKIVAVVGARPNLIKVAALLDALKKRPCVATVLVHTGQHYDERMSDYFFRDLGIPEPDYYLDVRSGTQAVQTAQVMIALEPLLVQLRPDLVLVVGDVNSTLAAALVAVKLHIRLAHVEAGLRSFDRTMPEEVNRVVTDALSDLLFTTEQSGEKNLRNEGVSADRIHFVGNVMIDTLLKHRERALSLDLRGTFGVQPGNYAVVTLHRPSNVDDGAVLARFIDMIGSVQEILPVLFPLHPRTRGRLAEFGLAERVAALERLHLLEPQGYLEFLGLLAQARIVLTDSGGIQEETTILGVPCLTLRENTERPITVEQGTNRLVGTNPRAILQAVREVLEAPQRDGGKPPLWDGRAAERIADVLISTNGTRA
jgi:UDP-N-acetylglucosamine 2-epimerase (non-hydrolysing)